MKENRQLTETITVFAEGFYFGSQEKVCIEPRLHQLQNPIAENSPVCTKDEAFAIRS